VKEKRKNTENIEQKKMMYICNILWRKIIILSHIGNSVFSSSIPFLSKEYQLAMKGKWFVLGHFLRSPLNDMYVSQPRVLDFVLIANLVHLLG